MPHRPLAEKRQNALSALDLLAGDPAEQDTIRQACRDCASQLRAQTDELLAYQIRADAPKWMPEAAPRHGPLFAEASA